MRRALLFALFAALLAVTSSAWAHDPFEVTTAAKLRATQLELVVTMTRKTALELATPQHEAQHDFLPLAPELFTVSAAGEVLTVQASNVELADNEVAFHVTYLRPPGGPLRLAATHLEKLGEGYTTAFELSQDAAPGSKGFKILTTSDSAYELALDAPPSDAAASPATNSTWSAFFVLGMEHVLEGYDHLLFLAGLLIAASTQRQTARLITAFTLSHSFTLVLAALGWVAVPGALVEPLIAASILVVGVENLWLRNEPRHRVALVFAFGLIHGLGFAGALQHTGFAESSAGPLLGSIVCFNLGVEAAQIALALVALPLLWKARAGRFGAPAVALGSLAISLVGAYLFVVRL